MNLIASLNQRSVYRGIFCAFAALLLLSCSKQEVSIERDVVYRSVGDQKLLLDVYRLPSEKIEPALVFIHGGG